MKVIKTITAVLLAGVLVIGMASCGGNSPKALAKQVVDLTRQTTELAQAALNDPTNLSNAAKAAELAQKLADVEEKVDNLSESDMEVYSEEILRLMASGQ